MTQVPLTCIPGQELHGLAGLICISWLLVGSHEPCPTGQTSDADHMNLGMPNTHNGLARSSRTALSKCEWCAGPRCLHSSSWAPSAPSQPGWACCPEWARAAPTARPGCPSRAWRSGATSARPSSSSPVRCALSMHQNGGQSQTSCQLLGRVTERKETRAGLQDLDLPVLPPGQTRP